MPQRCVRARLEVTASGLQELHYLRLRQEALVRTALHLRQENGPLLGTQLDCLRTRDAGLFTHLQELNQQISDLRLDTDESHDQQETTDSRASSGFYELSDGVSGSLSNSSTSVFSECLCSAGGAVGHPPTADERIGCLDDGDSLVGRFCLDFPGTIHRSCSDPQALSQDPVLLMTSCDSHQKGHCDPVVRNGCDMYQYLSPLPEVTIQSSSSLQRLGHGGLSREERLLKTIESGGEGIKPDSASLSVPPVPQSLSWSVSSSPSCQTLYHKRLNSYIYTLLQRKAPHIRSSRPRTSINTDPAKSIARQVSLCLKQASGPASSLGTLSGCEGERSSDGAATSSPQRQWSGEEQETQSGFHGGCVGTKQNDFKMKTSDCLTNPGSCFSTIQQMNRCSYSLQRKKSDGQFPPSTGSTAMLHRDLNELGKSEPNSTPQETKQLCDPSQQTQLFPSPTGSPGLLRVSSTKNGDESVSQPASLLRDSQSRQGGVCYTKSIPTQLQSNKVQRSGRKMRKRSRASEPGEPTVRKADKPHHRTSSKKSQLLEDRCSAHLSSSRIKSLPVAVLGGRGQNKNTSLTLSSVRSGTFKHHKHGNHHHHNGHHRNHDHHHLHRRRRGRDQVSVVVKQKNKRSDTQRLRVIMEVPHMEALQHAQRQQREELLSNSTASLSLTCSKKLNNSHCHSGGSDSEYSAECASLFHSTIMDTSEDEMSNYTTNCFGDSECSAEEDAEENNTSSSSHSEESGTGGAGGGTGDMRVEREWSQLGSRGVTTEGQDMTAAQKKAGVKIKASHNLKKRILRFRSGSLRLMTTV